MLLVCAPSWHKIPAQTISAISPQPAGGPAQPPGFTIKPLIMSTIERIRLGDLAARLGCTLHGDPDITITGVAGVERAGPSELTFLANPKYAPKVKETRAGAILVKQSLAQTRPASLVSANPYHDFARALALFYQPPQPTP